MVVTLVPDSRQPAVREMEKFDCSVASPGAASAQAALERILGEGTRFPKLRRLDVSGASWLTDVAATTRVLLGLPPDPSPEAIGTPIRELVEP